MHFQYDPALSIDCSAIKGLAGSLTIPSRCTFYIETKAASVLVIEELMPLHVLDIPWPPSPSVFVECKTSLLEAAKLPQTTPVSETDGGLVLRVVEKNSPPPCSNFRCATSAQKPVGQLHRCQSSPMGWTLDALVVLGCIGPQQALPDLNSKRQIPVGTTGPTFEALKGTPLNLQPGCCSHTSVAAAQELGPMVYLHPWCRSENTSRLLPPGVAQSPPVVDTTYS